MSIGKRLEEFATKQYRTVTNLNKEVSDLSQKKTSLYKYIKDERSPGSTILVPLAQLGINLNWLLAGEGDMLYNESGVDMRAHDSEMNEFLNEKAKLEAQVSILKQIVGDLITKDAFAK